FAVVGIFLLASVALILWYTTLPYNSPTIATVKWIHYPLTVLFVAFSFVYLGIPFKRVNRYYKLTLNLKTGIRETSTGSFFEYSNTIQDKDGVDFKALIFLEWNKYKNDFFERKVLVFDEEEFPEFTEGMNVRYVTQGNVLVSYQILDDKTEEQEGE
ncbi:MAG: hypothetical protein IJW47_03825, partial [Clostridia bacterium]|nr:hypothetical protein [Clostridia bacterium]